MISGCLREHFLHALAALNCAELPDRSLKLHHAAAALHAADNGGRHIAARLHVVRADIGNLGGRIAWAVRADDRKVLRNRLLHHGVAGLRVDGHIDGAVVLLGLHRIELAALRQVIVLAVEDREVDKAGNDGGMLDDVRRPTLRVFVLQAIDRRPDVPLLVLCVSACGEAQARQQRQR